MTYKEAQQKARDEGFLSSRAKLKNWRCSNCKVGWKKCKDFNAAGEAFACKKRTK